MSSPHAMLNLLNDMFDPKNAYPAFWEPLVVVSGGTAR